MTDTDEVLHFGLDVPPYPKGEPPSEDEMRGVSALLVGRDVAETELIETAAAGDAGVDRGDWKENDPGNEPDRQ